MVTDEELRQKRKYVAFFSALCMIGAGGVAVLSPDSEGLQGALLRVGILMFAFWLAMPTKERKAAWKILSSNWILIGSAIIAAAIPRLRAMFPVLAVFAAVAWFAMPRKSKDQN